jgi:hypothetical protein
MTPLAYGLELSMDACQKKKADQQNTDRLISV